MHHFGCMHCRWSYPLVTSAIVGLVIAGCEGADPAAPPEPNALAASRLELRTRLSRSRVSAGDTFTVTIVARNVSGMPVDLDPGQCTPLAYEMLSPSGARVGAWGFGLCGFIGGAPSFRLAPGDSTVAHLGAAAVHWYGATQAQAPTTGRSLPAGIYIVHGGLISTRDSSSFVARAAAVPVTVTAGP